MAAPLLPPLPLSLPPLPPPLPLPLPLSLPPPPPLTRKDTCTEAQRENSSITTDRARGVQGEGVPPLRRSARARRPAPPDI